MKQTLKKTVNCLSCPLTFLCSLLLVHLFAAIGSFDFSTIFPWLLLLLLMFCFTMGKTMFPKGMDRAHGHELGYALFCIFLFWELKKEHVLFFGNIRSVIGALLILPIIFFSMLCLLHPRRADKWCACGALLFALFSCTANKTIFDSYGLFGWLCSLFCWFLLFYLVLAGCSQLCSSLTVYGNTRSIKKGCLWGGCTFLLTFCADFIFFLAYYPGVMEFDSFIQMKQIWDKLYNNHHPWLHTMLIKAVYELGLSLFNSTNKAFALYSLSSIGMLSFTFACVIFYLSRKGLKSQYLLLVLLLYAGSPINQIYSITMWKDIPFGVCVVLFTILLCTLYDFQAKNKSCVSLWILFVPLSFCVCFFRSNGIFVIWGMLPFLLWKFRSKKKNVLISYFFLLLFCILYKGPIFHHYGVTEPDPIESLSIPAQQIAAVISYDGEITEEQTRLLEKIIDLKKVPDAYLGSPTCADAVKDLVRETDRQQYLMEHGVEYLKLWCSLFWKNKHIYVNAFIDETCGYWYHKVIFPFIWSTYINENGYGIVREPKILSDSAIDKTGQYLTAYKAHFDKYLSVGLYIYICLGSFFLMLNRKNPYWFCCIPCIGIWGTLLIATPVYADFRYGYAIYLAVPLLVCLSPDPPVQREISKQEAVKSKLQKH